MAERWARIEQWRHGSERVPTPLRNGSSRPTIDGGTQLRSHSATSMLAAEDAGATPVSPRSAQVTRLALVALLVVLFLTFLDNTVVSVTLGQVQADLHADVTQLQWVVGGYALVFASLMLTAGTLGDLLGRKKVMLIGVGIFCAGSVVCGAATSVDMLIGGRVIMGIGAAASEPGTLSMIRHLYVRREARARAIGSWAAISALALALGPVIGGTLIGLWSWRAVFWFNLAFGIVALAIAAAVLPESADPIRRRLDLRGFALAAIALGAATFAVISGETAGYETWWVDLLFLAGCLAAIVFVWAERRAANPIVDVRYFTLPAFTGANLIAFAVYFSVFSIFFFVALYLEVVGSVSAYSIAIDFLPMALGMILASVVSGRWIAARGARAPMTIGCILAGAGIFATMAVITPHAGISSLGWTLPMAGIGFGLAVVPVTAIVLRVVPAEHSGMAASATNTSRELGAVAGVAVLGSVVNAQLTTNLTSRLAAIGIPEQFRSIVITAVTTGTVSEEAAAVPKHGAVAAIVHKVITAAYGAFHTGLDLSLVVAGCLMLAAAIAAATIIKLPNDLPEEPGDRLSAPSTAKN
jgi:EmrB/QacA subfamily drug resistance transporter